MANKTTSRTKAQAARDKRALKILRDKGLYSGKVDLRKAPTRYQRKAMLRFDAVIKGKSAVLEPSSARAYKGTFDVHKNKVIVPKAKGDRLKVDKSGEIVGVKKIKGGKVRTRHVIGREKISKLEKPQKITTYAVPFKGKRGEIYWRRFTPDNWNAFINQYKRGDEASKRDWNDHVVVEEFDFDEIDLETVESQLFGEDISESEIKPVNKSKPRRKRK